MSRQNRRTAATALAGLLTVAFLATAFAAPATAATDPIVVVNQDQLTVALADKVEVCAFYAAPGSTLTLQVQSGTSRRTLTTATVPTLGQVCASAPALNLTTKPGLVTVYAVLKDSAGTVIKDVAGKPRIVASYYDDWRPTVETSILLANPKQKVQVTALALGQKVRLQAKIAGKWTDVSSAQMPFTGKTGAVTLAFGTKTGSLRYRAVSNSNAWASVRVSPTKSMFINNTVKYKTYIAKARSYMKTYCPSTPIFINSPDLKASRATGLETDTWWTSGGKGTLAQYIELRSGMSNAQLRHAALHECAHAVQGRTIVGTNGNGYRTYNAKMTKVYGKSPAALEQQADCMAVAITKSKTYAVYTKNCSGKRGTEAKALWTKLGKKYQGATTKWTIQPY